MSNLEPNAQEIVGCVRDESLHIARADSARQIVTILHPMQCLDFHEDLRECSFSKSLDLGISERDWRESEDRPVVVEIDPNGTLVPFPLGTMRAGFPLIENHSFWVQQKLNEDAHQ